MIASAPGPAGGLVEGGSSRVGVGAHGPCIAPTKRDLGGKRAITVRVRETVTLGLDGKSPALVRGLAGMWTGDTAAVSHESDQTPRILSCAVGI